MAIKYGTNGSDSINGTEDDDFLYGYPSGSPATDLGTNTIYGFSGDDHIEGGAYWDYLYGGDGDDTLIGGDGRDSLNAGGGARDRIDGGAGDDIAYFDRRGQTGDFVLNATRGSTIVSVEEIWAHGGSGNDRLTGSVGDDVLDGDAGDDILNGAAGDDRIFAGDGLNDRVKGGAGFDRAEFNRSTQVIGFTLDATDGVTVVGIEHLTVYAGTGDDTLIGGAEADEFHGGVGDDTLIGGAGDDQLDAGIAGVDKIDGGDGFDTASFYRDAQTGDFVLDASTGTAVVNIEALYVFSGSGNDTITGSGGADYIDGGAGNDTLNGGAGGDEIYGGDGNDTLMGGEGDDYLDVGAGANDKVDGGAGYDTARIYRGGQAADFVLDASTSTRVVSIEVLSVSGGTGNDTLTGGAEIDTFYGGNGNDTLKGGAGDDHLYAGAGLGDKVDGGAGFDTAFFERWSDTAGFTFDATDGVTAVNIEELSVYGGSGNDRMTGGAEVDVFDGGRGDDILKGGAGDDYLNAGEGIGDRVNGGDGFDTATFSRYSQTAGFTFDATDGITAISIEDLSVYGGSGGDTLIGGGEIDFFQGSGGDDVLTGGAGDDKLVGDGGNDTLSGGDGDDYLDAGAGSTDKVNGGAGFDTAVFYRGNQPSNFVFDASSGSTVVGIEHLTVIGSYSGNDTLIGGAEIDRFYGGDGSDVLKGGAGDDYLDASYGLGDRVDGGAGYDTAVFNRSNQTVGFTLDATDGVTAVRLEELTVYGGSGSDRITGGDEVDYFTGGGGNDILIGGAGDDYLDVGAGSADKVNGGAGFDTAVFSRGGQSVGFTLNASTGTAVVGIEVLTVYGGSGNDTLTGGGEVDRFFGNDGKDLLRGGAGDDYLDAGGGMGDRISGGSGYDTAMFDRWDDTAGFALDATDGTTVSSIEELSVRGGSGNDAITGGAEADSFQGNGGDDLLIGGAGDDWLDVGDGANDWADGGAGNDTAVFNWAGRKAGFTFNVNSDAPFIDIETLIVIGGTGNDTMSGGAEADRFFGNAGNDLLKGGAGDDYLNAGSGSGDRVIGGSGSDTAVFDRRIDTAGFTFDATDGITVVGIEHLEVYGGYGADTIAGGEGADILSGGGNTDVMTGGAGNDSFIFVSENFGNARDAVVDFDGKGTADGDRLLFVDFGSTADGASFVQLNETQWRVTSADGERREVITFANGANIDASDFEFVPLTGVAWPDSPLLV